MKRYAVLIGAAASVLAAGSAAILLANASAGSPAPVGIGFIPNHQRPIAGHLFRAAVVVQNREPSSVTIRRVRCDAQVGNQRLRGRQQRYAVQSYKAADAVCSWRLPAGAGGKTLRLWNYRLGRRVVVFDASGFIADSPEYSWHVFKH
jgi:hypothetical protein